MIYKTAVAMRRDQFECVNRLLEIRSLMDMTEEQFQRIGAKANESSLLYTASFSNGVIIELHLISDSMLYVTIPKYVLPDGRYVFEPTDAAGKELDAVETFVFAVEPFCGDYVVHLVLTE